jgi:hypothetical protein
MVVLSFLLPVPLRVTMEAAPDVALDVTSLPRPLVRDIFELLPIDTRLRCVEVCRAWRGLFSQPSMWSLVDFRGLRDEQHDTALTTELLWAAAARARGRIEVLDLCFCAADPLVVMARWQWCACPCYGYRSLLAR